MSAWDCRWTALMVVVALGGGPQAALADDGVADRVVLRDGSELLGQVIPAAPRSGRVEVIVRRAWVESRLPDRARDWDERARPIRRRAVAERADRLRRWRDDRLGLGPDPIAERIAAELERLADPNVVDRSPLVVVGLARREISRIDARPEPRRRLLRQGWRAGFEDVEAMPEDRLLAGLRDRGFPAPEADPAPIDDLLPIPLEDERRWLFRRAATEALHDAGLHLIRFGDLVLPEPSPGAEPDVSSLVGAVGGLLDVLRGDGPAADPLRPHLDRIEAGGRVGAVVTRLDLGPGFDRVAVEAALLVRTAPGRWEPAARRRSELRVAELPPDAGRPLAEDPQVRAAFGLVQGLGLGRADPEARRMSLAVGAAAQRALAEAREALLGDLRLVALDLSRPRDGGRRADAR